MNSRQETETKQIHPRALQELGEEACIAALDVASDLRSGIISTDEFNMQNICGSHYCILSYIALRIGRHPATFCNDIHWFDVPGFHSLTDGRHPSNPFLAADAIERYIYTDTVQPWFIGEKK